MTDTRREFAEVVKVKFGWLNALEVLGTNKHGDAEFEKVFWAYEGFQAALAHSQKDEKPLWVKPKAYPESSVLCYLKLSNGKVIEGSCRRDWDGIGWYKGYPGMCNGFSMADPDVVGWMYKHQTKLTLEQLNAITNRKDE